MRTRRCTSESCQSKAQRTFTLDLPVANLLWRPRQEWGRIRRASRIRVASDRKLEVEWGDFQEEDYLFSHATIVCSVVLAPNGYHIEPPCDELVNSNGNAWSNEVLLACFKSFVGKNNFYEHCQVEELSKGRILDAVLRPVRYQGRNGGEANVFFCDILVATERRHTDLVRRIASGQLSTMSMGCSAHWIQCSKCGKQFDDWTPSCAHLEGEILSRFVDEDGQERVVAELCGRVIDDANGNRVGDPKSCEFCEASWVESPAFKGAVLNHYIGELPKTAARDAHRVVAMRTPDLDEAIEGMFRMRVADRVGMIVLRVAQEEMRRRKLEDVARRVERWV